MVMKLSEKSSKIKRNMTSLINNLPKIKGKYRENSDLSKINWFNVGGRAEVLFRPLDVQDLSYFLKNKPDDIPVTILGVGSNLLVRDGGIDGVVIRLGRGFSDISTIDGHVIVGASALDVNVAKIACNNSIGGLEFLSGIPGTIGGALSMNAGAYGSEIKDIFVSAEAVDENGDIHNLAVEDMGFHYRGNKIPDSWIFTKAVFRGKITDKNIIEKNMQEIAEKRGKTQPIRSRTSGSTFRNPDPEISNGKKAWELIDEVEGRGLQIGGAMVSKQHCNFLINTGSATACDIEELGEEIRRRVKDRFDIELMWEIKRIGKFI